MIHTPVGVDFLRVLLLALALTCIADRVIAEPSPPIHQGGYIGSAACEGCHTYIYQTWKSTRHGSSILTGVEAKNTGYPLPIARRGGQAPTIRAWDDVAYVIGRRQRIAYIDRAGKVQDTSYHHRIGKWSPFPTGIMTECGTCHFTGFGLGKPHPDDQAVPGRWVEQNIGCEACHGPGASHKQSYDKKDIVVDASSRMCGKCHTLVGKVLPDDNYHDTHDSVQVWNRDRHVTGIRFQSHNALCSRCHAPFQGGLLESIEDSNRSVFTEHKQNITCIGCHNPHELTNARYTSKTVSLEPARLPQLHTYRGNDKDFTTTDFTEFETVETVCVNCHKGADRIDLDHAGATCDDCHNSFSRNRSLESRVFRDANHPGISCRTCHLDADHLMSILFRDADFLQPKYIHNLRTLPEIVKKRYRFQFADLPYRTNVAGAPVVAAKSYTNTQSNTVAAEPTATHDSHAEASKYGPRGAESLRNFLASQTHRRLTKNEDIRILQDALTTSPETVGAYIDLALAYWESGEYGSAREVIDYGAAKQVPIILFQRPFEDRFQPRMIKVSRHQVVLAPAQSAPSHASLPESEATRLLLQALTKLIERQFADAAQDLAKARKLQPQDPSLGFYSGLAELGQQRYRSATVFFEAVLEAHPDHLGSRIALGLAHIERKRFKPAKKQLERVLVDDPYNPIANYLLGRGYLNQGEIAKAVQSLELSMTAAPGFLGTQFLLAKAYRMGGNFNSASQIYETIIENHAGLFDAHYQLASLLKVASDSIAFQSQSELEKARPPQTSVRQWQEYLSELQQQSNKYGQLALAEFAIALSIKSNDVESIRQVSEIYRRSGRLSEAQSSLEQLARRQPDKWIHFYRLGTVLIERQQYPQAIQTLKYALSLAPTEGDVHFALGLAYVRTGRYQEAIQTFNRATVFEPFNPALYTNLGAAYASHGNYDLARKTLQRSLELASFPLPRVHLTYTNLALVNLHEGRQAEAIKALKNALHVFPDYTRARTLLDAAASNNSHDKWSAVDDSDFVFNGLLEMFGEITTITFDNE